MFVKLGDDSYVNLNYVKEIYLVEEESLYSQNLGKFCWVFSMGKEDGKVLEVESQYFETTKEAYKWFEENIKPILEKLNNQ